MARKLKLQIQMSIDGHIAGTNGKMDWMVWNWDEKLKEYVKELTDTVDCIILGRKLAQGFIPHWSSHPELEGAEFFNSATKVVFTGTLDKSEWENTVLAKDNLIQEIDKLKNQDGKDIIAYGGGTFVSSLIKYELIDEFHLFINPTIIGNGMTIFKDVTSNQNLILKKSIGFACGIAVLSYIKKT